MIAVRSLLGLGSIPNDRTAATSWLVSKGIVTHADASDGCRPEYVPLSDLPEQERLAYLRREIDRLHLDPGTYDDAAHTTFLEAALRRRERADRKAAAAWLMVALGASVPWPERVRLVQERLGKHGFSKPRSKALLKAVEGVDPINFAPALLDNYKGKTTTADITADAWSFFMTTIRDAGPEFPLTQACRDTRDVAAKMGWDWPSYPTIFGRWAALTEAQRLEARYGRADATKRLSIPASRDKTSIGPLDWVSLDGRTQDFWMDWGDGRAVRPVMIALVDVASNMVLDFELAPSENAAGTVRPIKRTCEQYGIFDRLDTDNGSAFAGHLVAGGTDFRFRNGGKAREGVQPLAIAKHMGIDIKFALPANGQAKIAERTFASLSRVVDDRPDFRNATLDTHQARPRMRRLYRFP